MAAENSLRRIHEEDVDSSETEKTVSEPEFQAGIEEEEEEDVEVIVIDDSEE